MKILLIHSYYHLGGGEDQVFEQEYELLRKQNEIETLTFKNDPGLKGLFQFLISFNNIGSNRKLKKVLENFKPDVVHIHNLHFSAGWGLIKILKNMNIPIVMTLHNYRLLCATSMLMHNNSIYLHSLNKKFNWHSIHKKVFKNSLFLTFIMELYYYKVRNSGILNYIDKFIVLTEFSKNIYYKSKLNLDPLKIAIKPNFVNYIELSNLSVERKNLLFVGRLSQEKGIQTIINSLKKSNYLIKIIGDGPCKDNVIQESNENISNFKYLGRKSKEGVCQEMKKSELLIFSSVCYETFGLVIIEAFSNSLPVIASNLGSISTLIKDGYNGFHFEAGNSNDLLLKIEKWYNLPENEKDIMRNNARETFLKHYTPEKNYSQLMDIYKSVIDPK